MKTHHKRFFIYWLDGCHGELFAMDETCTVELGEGRKKY